MVFPMAPAIFNTPTVDMGLVDNRRFSRRNLPSLLESSWRT